MGKLKSLGSRLPVLGARLAPPAGYAARDSALPWRRWYKTKRWQRLRWAVLQAARFTCAFCGRVESDTSQLVADHKVAHRGDAALFWDRSNLQCLCSACHSGKKQRMERRGW